MNFSDAVRQSMELFFKGKLDLTQIEKEQGSPIKFTRDYFDALEKAHEETPEEEETDEA